MIHGWDHCVLKKRMYNLKMCNFLKTCMHRDAKHGASHDQRSCLWPPRLKP